VTILLEHPITLELQHSLRRGIQLARRRGQDVLVSVSEPASARDLIELFDRGRQLTPDCQYWSQPGDELAFAGLGIAFAIEVVEASRFRQAANAWRRLLTEAIVEGPRGLPGVGPLLLGGFAFDVQEPASELWRGYPPGRLVLPRLLFTRAQGQTWLTYNAVVASHAEPDVEAANLRALRDRVLALAAGPARKNGHRPHALRPNGRVGPVAVHELRPAAEWKAEVAQAARVIKSHELEKVVLARAVQLRADKPFDPVGALRHLAAHYRGCYLFAVARGERCFLGATPEQLARLRADEVTTMSLAGSIRRGETPDEDERLGQALLDSAKDRDEHAVVTRAMMEALGETCVDLLVSDEPSLLKLGNIQHLCTPIRGRLNNGHGLLDLVERLHPTPAVGGRPRDAALQLIREHERLDRGWYAGPVGWLDERGEGEFAVALRSALLHGNTATLFAGCGIVADSDPEREYAEADLKFKPMSAALNPAGH
jgi:isochorismate synthase